MAERPGQDGGDLDIGDLVRRHATRYTASSGLAARLGEALDAAAAAERRPVEVLRPRRATMWWPLALAASFVLAIVLSSGTTWYITAADRQGQLAQEVVASHVRSLQADHLTDVASSDQHTVKPWFDGKLDLAPPVVDLKARGFPLVGGRLDYVDRRPVAALVYRYKQHVINLFVWTTSAGGPAPSPPAEIHGYNLRHWRAGDFTFWAVSDVESHALDQFVNEIKAATG